MVGVGRDLWRSASPTQLLKQDHLEQVSQNRVQVGSESLQRRRLHNLSGQPVPVLGHPQREDVFPHIEMENDKGNCASWPPFQGTVLGTCTFLL